MAGKVLVSVRYLARFPVWSCLRLCLDRPAFLAPGCCFLALGTGFGRTGGRTGATGNGRRETERRGRPLVRYWKGTSADETVAVGWQIGEISGLEWWVQEYVPRSPSLSLSPCLSCVSVSLCVCPFSFLSPPNVQ